jgi:hypothetical protein
MAASRGSSRRRLIPRWRGWRRTARLGELAGVEADRIFPSRLTSAVQTSLQDAKERYEESPNLATATDLAAVAIMLQERIAVPVELETDDASAPSPNAWLRGELQCLHEGKPQGFEDEYFAHEYGENKVRIARLRQMLHLEPRNAVRWVDFALEQTIRGNRTAAGRAIAVATNLCPENRFVLRSAARFYVHVNEPDRAHWLFERSVRTSSDPWLAAAAVAVADAAKLPTRHKRAARGLIEDAGVFPWHASELSGALATEEWKAGADRRGRQLMRFALEQPTENVLAQAEWAHEEGLLRDRESFAITSAAHPHEAVARHAAYSLEWQDAVDAAYQWLNDQPFSEDAAAFGSWAASQSGNYKASSDFCRDGLLANENSALLMNNLAYAEACEGNFAEAITWVKRARSLRPHPYHQALLSATAGLICFKSGDADQGRRLYESAITAFNRLGEKDSAAMATVLLAEAELQARTAYELVALTRAMEAVRGSNEHFVKARWSGRTESLAARVKS